jgi:hypothetical protein
MLKDGNNTERSQKKKVREPKYISAHGTRGGMSRSTYEQSVFQNNPNAVSNVNITNESSVQLSSATLRAAFLLEMTKQNSLVGRLPLIQIWEGNATFKIRLIVPMRAACPAHLILLDLTIPVIFVEGCFDVMYSCRWLPMTNLP